MYCVVQLAFYVLYISVFSFMQFTYSILYVIIYYSYFTVQVNIYSSGQHNLPIESITEILPSRCHGEVCLLTVYVSLCVCVFTVIITVSECRITWIISEFL